MRVQLLPRHAGLHDAVHVLLVDREDRVHPAHVDRDAALRGVAAGLERRPGPERDDRDPVVGADADDRGDLLRALGEDDGVRRLHRMPAHDVGVLRPHGRAPAEAIAEAGFQGREAEFAMITGHERHLRPRPRLSGRLTPTPRRTSPDAAPRHEGSRRVGVGVVRRSCRLPQRPKAHPMRGRDPARVDRQGRARNRGGLVREEEGDGARDLLGLRSPAMRAVAAPSAALAGA